MEFTIYAIEGLFLVAQYKLTSHREPHSIAYVAVRCGMSDV